MQLPRKSRLWYDFLSTYEVRFQRQKAIGNFIEDFYCHKAKLIIELDGSQHYTKSGKINDEYRTEKLEDLDLKVIRFSNHQINTSFESVCNHIDKVVKSSIQKDNNPTTSSAESGGSEPPS